MELNEILSFVSNIADDWSFIDHQTRENIVYTLGFELRWYALPIRGSWLKKILNSAQSHINSQTPLLQKKIWGDAQKEFSVAHAKRLWAQDHEKKLRVGACADLILAVFLSRLPNEKVPALATLKKWIREVAPDHASKPGR